MEFFTCSINNPLAIMMIIIMFILLLVIGLLANVLLGTASFYKDKVVEEEKKQSTTPVSAGIMIGLLLTSFSAMAQDAAPPATIGGLSKSVFYFMTGIIFLEIVVILALLANVRILIAKERKRNAVTAPKNKTHLQLVEQNEQLPARTRRSGDRAGP